MHCDVTLTRRADHGSSRVLSSDASTLVAGGRLFFHIPRCARVHSWRALLARGSAGRQSRNRSSPVGRVPRGVKLHRRPTGALLAYEGAPLLDDTACIATPHRRAATAVFDIEGAIHEIA